VVTVLDHRYSPNNSPKFSEYDRNCPGSLKVPGMQTAMQNGMLANTYILYTLDIELKNRRYAEK
jgi:hypothetical protein